MEFWNQVIDTALLGTDKKQLVPAKMPPAIEVLAEQLLRKSINKEDPFLQIAALAFNYRQAGIAVVQQSDLVITHSPAEEKPWCSAKATQVLNDILLEENLSLLQFWLQQCQQHRQLISPELLPVLLQTGVAQKYLQAAIIDCGGNRAAWLSQFNNDWAFSYASREETWQTGSAAQRRFLLKELRREDPAAALAWIQQTWAQEDAATKIDFLKIMTIGIGLVDLPFLETLLTEKSKKVKDEALALLKKIPASAIVQQYGNAFTASVQLIQDKKMFGLIKEYMLNIKVPDTIDAAIYKTGIEKISSDKSFTDDAFIIYQLMQAIPPSFYEEHWQMTPEEIIRLFQTDATSKPLLPALVLSIVNFQDTRWAELFVQYSEVFYTDLIPLLPVQQQEQYNIRFFTSQPENIIHYATGRKWEWSTELAALIVQYAAAHPYQYNRAFFNQHIQLLPVSVAPALNSAVTTEPQLQSVWSNTCSYITRLLLLKTQTNRAFNE